MSLYQWLLARKVLFNYPLYQMLLNDIWKPLRREDITIDKIEPLKPDGLYHCHKMLIYSMHKCVKLNTPIFINGDYTVSIQLCKQTTDLEHFRVAVLRPPKRGFRYYGDEYYTEVYTVYKSAPNPIYRMLFKKIMKKLNYKTTIIKMTKFS